MSMRPSLTIVPEGAVWIETARLQAATNPFRDHPWGKPVTPAQVEACRKRGQRQAHIEEDWAHLNRRPSYHAARIATLMETGWSDPLQLDVGIPQLGHVWAQLVQDGYHRLAAAILLEDPWICVDIAGSVAHARHLFGKQHPCPPDRLPLAARTRLPQRRDV